MLTLIHHIHNRTIGILALSILIFSSYLPDLSGQHLFFTQETEVNNALDNMITSAIALADVDNDGLMDIFIYGGNDAWEGVASLYLNKGNLQFEKVDPEFVNIYGLMFGGAVFGDIDNDGFEDLLVFGYDTGYGVQETILYYNNGDGSFTAVNNPFPLIHFGFATFGDLDGDGALDLIIGGITYQYDFVTRIYKNDGFGNFTHDESYNLPQVGRGRAELADLNNDGFPDLILTGIDAQFNPVAKVYLNDGLGNLTEHATAGLKGVYEGSISVADVNGDGFPDIFLTGATTFSGRFSGLYINDGNANFTLSQNSVFNDFWLSSAQFSDVNKDGAIDLLVTGSDINYQSVQRLYLNNGLGVFTDFTQTNIEGVISGDMVFYDFDGDGDEDLLIIGENYKYEGSTILYTSTAELLPEPPVLDLGQDTTICVSENESYTIDAGSSDLIYLWNTGETTSSITIDSPGTYSLWVTNEYGQSAHDSVTISFKFGPVLDSLMVTSVNPREYTFAVAGDNIENYYWEFGDGTSSTDASPTHEYAEGGEYLITLIVSNDCGTLSTTYQINITTSVRHQWLDETIRIFPNPAEDLLSIEAGKGDITGIQIFGLDGQLIVEKSNLSGQNFQIDISSVPVGSYLVKIAIKEGGVVYRKLQIVR